MTNSSAQPDGAELQKLIEQASLFNNWVFPDREALKKEYDVEYQHHIQQSFGPLWPTFEDFVSAASDGKVITLTEQDDRMVSNRSHTRNMHSLVALVSTYRSWPEYRNMDTLRDMINRFRLNKPMKMPIILDTDGSRYLMSGNTKLDIAFMMQVEPKALVLSV